MRFAFTGDRAGDQEGLGPVSDSQKLQIRSYDPVCFRTRRVRVIMDDQWTLGNMVILRDAAKDRDDASRVRKSAESLMQSLKALENGFIKANDEKEAQMKREEQQKKLSDHSKAHVMLDADEQAQLDAAAAEAAKAKVKAEAVKVAAEAPKAEKKQPDAEKKQPEAEKKQPEATRAQ